MKILNKILSILFLVVSGMSVFGQNAKTPQPLHAEILLSSDMLKEVSLDINFVNSFNITSAQLLLLSSPNQFYVVGLGGIKPVGKNTLKDIYSFDYAPEGNLMVVNNKELSYIDSLGNYAHYYSLPNNKMGITSGKKNIYIFDQNENLKTYNLYVLSQGNYNKLFSFPSSINAVCELNESIYFASENKLYSISILNQELKEIARMENQNKIISVTSNSGGEIYFSDKNSVYTIKDNKVICVSDQFGGILKYYNGGLYVFSPERKFLINLIQNSTVTTK